MKTFFWGYFSTPWKRLLRTISVIIIIFFSLVLYDSQYDSDRIICIVIIISIPILSYVIEPFVLRNSMNSKGNVDSSKIIDERINSEHSKEPIKYNKEIIKKSSKFPIWLTYNNEYIKGNTYFLRMIFGIMTIWLLGFGLYIMIVTTYKRSKSIGITKKYSIISSILVPILIFISTVIKISELSTTNYIENIERYYLFLGTTYLLLLPHFILWFKNGNKPLFEINSKREKGKQFLEELQKKGPNLDSVGKTIVSFSSSTNDYDEPLSESRNLRKMKYDVNKEFPKNE